MKDFKLQLAYLIALFVFIQSCQQPCPEAEEEEPGLVSISPNMDQDIAMVTAYMESLVNSDSAGIRSAIADDFMSFYMTSPIDSSSADEHIASWKGFGETRSNQNNEIIAASSLRVNDGQFKGDWVQIWGTYTATMNDSGKDFAVPYFVNLNIVDGKISKEYGYYDRLGINLTLGYELTMAE